MTSKRIAQVSALCAGALVPLIVGCPQSVEVRPVLTESLDAASGADAAPVPTGATPALPIGGPAPAFTLDDLSGQPRSLAQLVASGNLVVLEWVDPTSRAWRMQHMQRGDLHRTHRSLDARGVAWLGVCSFDPHASTRDVPAPERDVGRPGPGRPHMGMGPRIEPPGPDVQGPSGAAVLPLDAAQATERCRAATNELGLTFPIVLDHGGEVARRYRVTQVPYVVALDRQGRVVFSGAPEPVKPPPPSPLARTLQAVLRGEGPGPTSVPAGSPSSAPRTTAPPLPREDSPGDEIEKHYVGEEGPGELDLEERYQDEDED